MSKVVLVYGPIGSGKTSTCIKLVERLRSVNHNVGGVLSKRVYHEGDLIGYDCLDASSGQVFPLVRLRNQICGPDWFNFGELKYAFSSSGFKLANSILSTKSRESKVPTLVFIDEFGRLERAGVGIYSGVLSVVESLKNGSIAIIACRTDMIETVERVLIDRVKYVEKCEPGDIEKLWDLIKGSIPVC